MKTKIFLLIFLPVVLLATDVVAAQQGDIYIVKIADALHNSDVTRIKNPTPEDKARAKRYEYTITFLKMKKADVAQYDLK